MAYALAPATRTDHHNGAGPVAAESLIVRAALNNFLKKSMRELPVRVSERAERESKENRESRTPVAGWLRLR